MSANNIKDYPRLTINNDKSLYKNEYNKNNTFESFIYYINDKEDNCQIKNNVLKNIIQKNKNKEKDKEKNNNYLNKNNNAKKINLIINDSIYNNIKKINKKNINKNNLYKNNSILSIEANKAIKDYNYKQEEKKKKMKKRNILINKAFSNNNTFNYLPMNFNNLMKKEPSNIFNKKSNNKNERGENIFNNDKRDKFYKSITFSRTNKLIESENRNINYDSNNKTYNFYTNVKYKTIENK